MVFVQYALFLLNLAYGMLMVFVVGWQFALFFSVEGA
jgi:hypothetical protein